MKVYMIQNAEKKFYNEFYDDYVVGDGTVYTSAIAANNALAYVAFDAGARVVTFKLVEVK